jgi:membrane-associated protein
VTAGLFAARGDLPIGWLIPSLIAAAICGNATGYFIGRKAGAALYSRPNSLLFRREHLIRTHEFYERHGGKTIILAQFMPIVRTFAPVVAGAAAMTYRRFASFNVIGAILWIASMTLTGFFLGRAIPNIESRIHIVVAVVIFLSILPGIIAWVRSKLKARAAAPVGEADQRSGQLHLAHEGLEARVVPDEVEVRVAQDRHHHLVAFFDSAVEPLKSGVDFAESEVYVAEIGGEHVAFRSSELLQ